MADDCASLDANKMSSRKPIVAKERRKNEACEKNVVPRKYEKQEERGQWRRRFGVEQWPDGGGGGEKRLGDDVRWEIESSVSGFWSLTLR
jgi:hypothetical protein